MVCSYQLLGKNVGMVWQCGVGQEIPFPAPIYVLNGIVNKLTNILIKSKYELQVTKLSIRHCKSSKEYINIHNISYPTSSIFQ